MNSTPPIIKYSLPLKKTVRMLADLMHEKNPNRGREHMANVIIRMGISPSTVLTTLHEWERDRQRTAKIAEYAKQVMKRKNPPSNLFGLKTDKPLP